MTHRSPRSTRWRSPCSSTAKTATASPCPPTPARTEPAARYVERPRAPARRGPGGGAGDLRCEPAAEYCGEGVAGPASGARFGAGVGCPMLDVGGSAWEFVSSLLCFPPRRRVCSAVLCLCRLRDGSLFGSFVLWRSYTVSANRPMSQRARTFRLAPARSISNRAMAPNGRALEKSGNVQVAFSRAVCRRLRVSRRHCRLRTTLPHPIARASPRTPGGPSARHRS